MGIRTRAFGVFCFALILVAGERGAPAAVTPLQTDSIPVTTQTDWGPTTPSLQGQNPMVFNKFDPSLGTLQGVDITMTYSASEVASMTFTTPSTISLRTSQPGSPNVGTRIFINGPADTPGSNLLSASLPVLTYTKTYGTQAGQTLPQTFSTSNPAGSQFYLTPDGQTTNAPQTGTVTVHITDPAQLALFTGPGTIGLPAHANAGSTFVTNTGNGSGTVMTFAGVTANLQYSYAAVPEPSSMALLGLGGGGLLLAGRSRRRTSAA